MVSVVERSASLEPPPAGVESAGDQAQVGDEMAVQISDGLGCVSAAGLTGQCGLHDLAVPLACNSNAAAI